MTEKQKLKILYMDRMRQFEEELDDFASLVDDNEGFVIEQDLKDFFSKIKTTFIAFANVYKRYMKEEYKIWQKKNSTH